MSIVKPFAIGDGDMYYIRHGSDNFTIIDCNLPDDRMGSILAELKTRSKDKGITRFISTHDHTEFDWRHPVLLHERQDAHLRRRYHAYAVDFLDDEGHDGLCYIGTLAH